MTITLLETHTQLQLPALFQQEQMEEMLQKAYYPSSNLCMLPLSITSFILNLSDILVM